MSTQEAKSLVQKLAKIMADTQWVPKKGRNNFFNYDYAKEADILDAVRNKLAEHGIFVFTSIESTEYKETGKRTRDGSPLNLVFVRTKHTFWDGESGETAEVFGSGSGEDSGDKAIYKAITGAMKYFLSKNFLISTGDDPEKDEDGGDRKEIGERQEAAPAASEAPSFTPVPQFQPASTSNPGTPTPPSPTRVSFENPAKDYVVDIQSKSGPKKD